MTTPMKTEETFDCVAFKRRAQLEIYEHIQGLTHEQERVYFQEQAESGPLGDWWKLVKTTRHEEQTA